MKRIFLLFCLILCLNRVNNLKSDDDNCSPEDYGCESVITQHITFEIPIPECTISLTYEKYVCPDGSTAYDLRDITTFGICDGMRDLNILHYSLSSLDELVTLAFFEEIQSIEGIEYEDLINGVFFVRTYTASCGIWVGCEYTVDPGTRLCDNGYQPPYPDYYMGEMQKVKAYKWQPCGITCCKRTYKYWIEGPVGQQHYEATYLGSEMVSPECTGQALYNPLQCENGCN